MGIRVLNYYPYTVAIDGEPVQFRIKRLTLDEKSAFMLRFNTMGRENAANTLGDAPRDETEQALTANVLEAKRWRELTPEQRLEKVNEERQQAAKDNEFAKEAITAYVTVGPDQVHDETKGCYVTSGEDVLRLFGARTDILTDLMAAIYLENTLSSDQKKKLLSRLDSKPSSSEAPPATGEKPESTAGSVEPEGSASPEGAMASLEENPSGKTALSS